MRAERIALGYAGMLEILLGIAHTDPLHDGSRPQVARGRERNDLRQGEPLETHAKSGSGCLGGEASAPMNSGEAPAPLPKPQTWCLEFNDCVPRPIEQRVKAAVLHSGSHSHQAQASRLRPSRGTVSEFLLCAGSPWECVTPASFLHRAESCCRLRFDAGDGCQPKRCSSFDAVQLTIEFPQRQRSTLLQWAGAVDTPFRHRRRQMPAQPRAPKFEPKQASRSLQWPGGRWFPAVISNCANSRSPSW